MNHFSFEYPSVLWLVPAYLFVVSFFKVKQQSYFIPNMIAYLPGRKKKRDLKKILKHLTVITALVALASPVEHIQLTEKNKHTLDIVLSLDTSGSMTLNGLNPQDYEQSRMDVVKEAVQDFVRERTKDAIGLVIFGDRSSVVLPLTSDKQVLLDTVSMIKSGIVGKSTALIESIVQSVMLLKNGYSSSKLIILLSDGDDTASKVPLEIALKIAKKYGIKIYTISIGESNNNLLHIISSQSGAKSFIAREKSDLTQVYETITKLEATTQNSSKTEIVKYYFRYVLLLSILFVTLFAFMCRRDEVL